MQEIQVNDDIIRGASALSREITLDAQGFFEKNRAEASYFNARPKSPKD